MGRCGRAGRGCGPCGDDDGQAVAVLAATRTPASHPGARPPPGGTWSVARPARARDHATSEFEFHISPPPGGRRPHVSGGTPRTARRIRATAAASRVTRTGGPTACSRSGIAPCAQQRTSYRNQRERPSGRRPTGPVTTTPRSHGGPPHAGVISTTYGNPSHRSPSAAWNSRRGRRRASSAAARSHAALVRRTTWPPPRRAARGAPPGRRRGWARSRPDATAREPGRER